MTFSAAVVVICVVTETFLATAGGAAAETLYSQHPPLEGSNVTLKCSIRASKTLAPEDWVWYRWTKNGRGLGVTQSDSLTLYNASAQDDGTYSCRLTSRSNGTDLSTEQPAYTLAVIAPPILSITHTSGDATHTVPEGSVLSLTCRVTKKPKPPVLEAGFTWSFHSHGGPREEVLPEKRKDLTIQPVHRNHSGRYTCRASTDGDFYSGYRASTSSILVQVLYLDSNLTLLPKERLTVVAGDEVNLTCQADSLPTATLTWLHHGSIITGCTS